MSHDDSSIAIFTKSVAGTARPRVAILLVVPIFVVGCFSADPNATTISQLESMGAKIHAESGIYTVDIRNAPEFTDAELDTLAKRSNVVELTLQKVPITDAGLSKLKPLVRINRLILNESDVTGEGGIIRTCVLEDEMKSSVSC